MRLAGVLLIAAVLVLSLSCGGSSIPSSSISIRNAATDTLLSSSTAQGTLTINVGNTVQIKVMRTWRNQAGNTLTDDVTQFADFKWDSGAGFATIDDLGNIDALGAGIAVLEIKFRDSNYDPWDICHMTVEVI